LHFKFIIKNRNNINKHETIMVINNYNHQDGKTIETEIKREEKL